MSKTHQFTEIVPNIYRLTVPFEDLYTTVYLCVCEGGTAIVDCATTAYDVENIIVPALRVLNAKLTCFFLHIATEITQAEAARLPPHSPK